MPVIRRCEMCGKNLPLMQSLVKRSVCDPCLERRNAAREQAKMTYRQAVVHALGDSVITAQEWQALEQLRGRIGVLPFDAFTVHREVFQAGHIRALQDRVVTSEEMRYLRGLAQQLRLPEIAVSEQLSEAARLHQLYYLQHGPLPAIHEPPINLQRGETCHWVEPRSAYIEERTERVRVSGSAGCRIRIAKGLSYRVGASRGYSYQVPVNVHADTGAFVITSKRVAFVGGRRSFAIPFAKLLAFQVFENAVQLQKDGQTAKPQVFTVQDSDAVSVVLSRAIDAGLA